MSGFLPPDPPRPDAAAPAPDAAPAPGAGSPTGFARLRLRGLVSLMLVTLVVAGVAAALLGRSALPDARRWLFPGLLLCGYGMPALWMAVAFRRHGISWRRLLGPLPPAGPTAGALGLTLVQLTLSAASFFALAYLLAHLAPDRMRGFLAHPERFGPGFAREPVPLLLLGTVVAAPLVEELLFRGVLLHRLAARWGPRRALVASALIFAVFHPMTIPAMFVFGLFLGVLYLRTGSLAACMLVHALNNLVPTLLAGTAPPESGMPGAGLTLEMIRRQGPFMLVVFAGATAVLVGYVAHHWPARDAAMPYDRAAPGPLAGADPPIR